MSKTLLLSSPLDRCRYQETGCIAPGFETNGTASIQTPQSMLLITVLDTPLTENDIEAQRGSVTYLDS